MLKVSAMAMVGIRVVSKTKAICLSVARNYCSKTIHSTRSAVPRRALMYVPCGDTKKLAKIPDIPADCIVLDLEDGVALSSKESAREKLVLHLSDAGKEIRRHCDLGVRVNSVDSGLLENDLKALASCSGSEQFPDSVMLPKVECIDTLDRFSRSFKHCFSDNFEKRMKLVIWIESAWALLNMPSILTAGKNLSTFLPLSLSAVVFGSDDFCADIGATRSSDATELLYARQKFVAICKAFKLQAIDIVYIDFKDMQGFRKQCVEGRRMGFDGKQVIHPAQVPIAHEEFAPSSEKIQWARELLSEYSRHSSAGTGAFDFRGQMIDMPLVLQARNIVALADRMN